jgi:hypothetical protein
MIACRTSSRFQRFQVFRVFICAGCRRWPSHPILALSSAAAVRRVQLSRPGRFVITCEVIETLRAIASMTPILQHLRRCMDETNIERRVLLIGTATAAVAAMLPIRRAASAVAATNSTQTQENEMTTVSFTKSNPPEWLLGFWKEIDAKTFGKGFDCFTKDAICNLGVADWHGREAIRENLRAFIDTGFTAHHEVVEYWDGGSLKVFRGVVTMTPDDKSKEPVHPTMTHFFYMDKAEPSKVSHWYGAVGPVAF